MVLMLMRQFLLELCLELTSWISMSIKLFSQDHPAWTDLVYGEGESEHRAWKHALQLMLRTSRTGKSIYPPNEGTACKGKIMQKTALCFTSM